MNLYEKTFLFLLLPFCSQLALAGSALPITPDGETGDWPPTSLLVSDAIDDGVNGGLDFRDVYLANDEDQLFLRVSFSEEFLLQSDNEMVWYLDLDNNPNTGLSIQDIGCDLSWEFGSRSGVVYNANGSQNTTIGYVPISLRQGPTVSSTEFEVAIARNLSGLNIGIGELSSIRFVLKDDSTGLGDSVPDSGSLAYEFDDVTPVPEYERIPIERKSSSDLRIVSHNAERSGWFDRPEDKPSFDRIYQALDPDIIAFQEVYRLATSNEIKLSLEETLGGTWYIGRNGTTDTPIAARFPFGPIKGLSGNVGALIDLPDDLYPTDLYIINAHTPCCSNNSGRYNEINEMMEWISIIKNPGGELTLEADTPIITLGDMNIVGDHEQPELLRTGGIYGYPDWDNSPSTDLYPYQNSARDRYTFRSDASNDFSPGKLDAFVYTDSVVEIGQVFVLNTLDMTTQELNGHHLQSGDVTTASDHWPMVVDFKLLSEETAVWVIE